jgi:hypothetical protein
MLALLAAVLEIFKRLVYSAIPLHHGVEKDYVQIPAGALEARKAGRESCNGI